MKKTITSLLLICFSLNTFLISLFSAGPAYAENINLPKLGSMVSLSDSFTAPVLKGIVIDPANPLNLKFNIDTYSQDNVSKAEVEKLVSYFLAALTIDKNDLWVNLSPYEKERITNDSLAKTELGKVLLEQDYILKQLSASLTHPASPTGKSYWSRVNSEEKIVNRVMQDLSKIWIVPEKALVHENGSSAYVHELSFDIDTKSEIDNDASLQAIVAEVKKDVNFGKNFSKLRQIFHAIVLAQWFKAKLSNSFYSQYINQNKTKGIELTDKQLKEKIWNQYLESFKVGAYDFIDKVKNPYNGSLSKQKFFCGGIQSSSIKVEAVQTHQEASYVGKKKTAEVELFSTKDKFKDLAKRYMPTFYNIARYKRAKSIIRNERDPSKLLKAFKVYLEYNDRDKLMRYANVYSRSNRRSYITPVIDTFMFAYSRDYLFNNINDFISLLDKQNWLTKGLVYRLFNLITDPYYWHKKDINAYSVEQLVKLSKTYDPMATHKTLNSHEIFDSGTDEVIASSSVEAVTLVSAGVLATTLVLYELYIKNKVKDKYKAAREAYGAIWKLHDYQYFNSHSEDPVSHAAIEKFFSYGHYAMGHLVAMDLDKEIVGDHKKAIEGYLLKMTRENPWPKFKQAMEYHNAHSRYAALYILRNLLKHKIITGLEPTFSLYDCKSDSVIIAKIKHLAKHDTDESVKMIANDIIDNYINPSSSSIMAIFADVNLHKYIQYERQLEICTDETKAIELERELDAQLAKVKAYGNHNFKALNKLLSIEDDFIQDTVYRLIKEIDPQSFGLNFILPHIISSKELKVAIELTTKFLSIARYKGENNHAITVEIIESYFGSEAIYMQEESTVEEYIKMMFDKYSKIWPAEKVNNAATAAIEQLSNGGIDSSILNIASIGSRIELAPVDIADFDGFDGFAFAVKQIN